MPSSDFYEQPCSFRLVIHNIRRVSMRNTITESDYNVIDKDNDVKIVMYMIFSIHKKLLVLLFLFNERLTLRCRLVIVSRSSRNL